jgi:hypothetical protein
MKLPVSVRAASQRARATRLPSVGSRKGVAPLDSLSGWCERVCAGIVDPKARELCLRSCGY